MSYAANDLSLFDSHIRTFNYRNLKRLDIATAGLAVALAAVGLITLYSASQSAAVDQPFYLKYYVKQGIFFLAGAVLALMLACTDFRAIVAVAPVLYLGSIALLVAVPLIGTTAMGGQHWLRYNGIGLQPSEFSKVVLVFALAWYLSRVQDRVHKFFYFAIAFVITGVMIVLILLQGDLGTAIVMTPLVFVMLWVAGCRKRHLLVVLIAGAVCGTVGILNIEHLPLKDYQKKRIQSFIDPASDPDFEADTGYQIIQTKIAVGSGRMWGKGLGQGTQTHLRFLPLYHTDFIFALLAEETGFIGSVILIGLYALLLLRGLAIARDCPDIAGSLLAAGCFSILASHVFVNVAITLNLLPVTGLPLPFMSYGGSFCLTTMLCVGTFLSVNVRRGFFE